MRGSLSDFHTATPTKPVAVNFLPPDFDPADVERYAAKPLAPEVRACERCQWQACHRALRATGQPLLSACAPLFELPTAWQPAPHPLDGLAPASEGGHIDPAGKRAAILAVLADGQLLSVYEIVAATGLRYNTARAYLNRLLREGRIAQGAQQQRAGNATLVRYCLTEHLTAAPVRGPRKPRCFDAAQARAAANDQRLLAELRARGPLAAAELAAVVNLTAAAVRMKLALLEAAGKVERAGQQAYQPDSAYFSTRSRALWRAVEERQ